MRNNHAKQVSVKAMVLVLAVVMLLGCAVGGTIAWLTAKSADVVNTFTVGNIAINLTETADLDLKMIPGWTITKDPKATVVAGSEDCYLFVKVAKSENFDTYMTYEIADGWTELTEAAGTGYKVYYRVFDSTNEDCPNVKGTAYSVLKNNQVSVLSTVDMATMNQAQNNKPTLTVTAYAIQLKMNNTTNFTPAQAWEQIPTA